MSNYLFRRLPSEILIKILSYLDASALFSISHVNKLFHQLANDNALWKKIYIAELGKKKKREPKCIDELLLRMEDGAAGYWKWLYFKTVAARDMNKWKRHLGHISRYTGLPSQTEQVLRCSTRWSEAKAFSLLCSVRPGWRSLMAKLDMQALTKSAQVIGQDRLVQLQLLQPGIIIGVWRDQSSVAFIMFTLHFHKLVALDHTTPFVEPVVKPPFDDIDPECGLHGYQLHIVLHNTVCKLMSGSFSQLFCRRSNLFILIITHSTNLSQHTRLSCSTTLCWQCEALQGAVENCCIMSLTLLDEFKKPFTCVTSPVAMTLEKTPVSYDYDGEHYLIHHQDSDSQVKMELVRLKDQQHFVLVSLVVYLSVYSVNKHFGRDY
uniref:F-box domain-containing protein n=1 Tax=Stegastes partitus TaxID=144197 RepID=A0A3B5B8I3_9TELE